MTNKNAYRQRLTRAAITMSAASGYPPFSSLRAAGKLFLAPKSAKTIPGTPRTGWKRGELIEILAALRQKDYANFQEEIGDAGYYVAQSWDWLWWLYAATVPGQIIEAACLKFEKRAAQKIEYVLHSPLDYWPWERTCRMLQLLHPEIPDKQLEPWIRLLTNKLEYIQSQPDGHQQADLQYLLDDAKTRARVFSASKFIKNILRHHPETIGLEVDLHGWADVDELIAKTNATPSTGITLDIQTIQHIVQTNNKQRFTLLDGKIRANQGHTIPVDLELPLATPPETLFHGTSPANVPSIMVQGLNRGQRHHVHLSPDIKTAQRVGHRRSQEPAVLRIAAGDMARQGHKFYVSTNGVWLVDFVPPQFINEAAD